MKDVHKSCLWSFSQIESLSVDGTYPVQLESGFPTWYSTELQFCNPDGLIQLPLYSIVQYRAVV